MAADPARDFLVESWRFFPLPIARLALRSRNAKSPKDRHDTAYFALEVSVRLGVAARPPEDPRVLRRASLGVWVSQLEGDPRRLEDPDLLKLYALLTKEGSGRQARSRSVRPRQLFDALAAYRNQVVGHGSSRSSDYYDEAASILQNGIDAAWRNGLFLPEGCRLTWVEDAKIDATGTALGRLLELTGPDAEVIDPRGTALPPAVLPRRLYLIQGGSFRPLHPWLLYREGSAREREAIYCFNGMGRVPQYLDYASGESLKGQDLEEAFPGIAQEVAALFAGAALEEAPEEAEADDPNRFGDYQILGKLGEGGMGVVYLARQLSLGRLVALKMLHPGRASDLTAVARFRREILALSRCEHPNVVKILASGIAHDTWYYAMEYVDGADLARVAIGLGHAASLDQAVESAWEAVRAERRELFEGVPPVSHREVVGTDAAGRHQRLARLFHDAALGVNHLHENGVVHRDIKPGNLMVTHHDLRAVVMDLGLAAVDTASITLTQDSSTILGTLRYLPPEQITRERGGVDRRADVYSLGATFYELLSGKPFLSGDSEARLVHQVLHEDPVPLETADPDVPRDLALIVRKATDKEPSLRYHTAEDLAEDLEAFLEAKPVSARPPTLGYLLRLWTRRNRKLAGSIAASALLIVVLNVVYVVFLRTALASEEAARRKYTELSDITGARALVEEVEELFPVGPALVERIQTWIERHSDLVSRRAHYRQQLGEGLVMGDRLRELRELEANLEILDALRPVVDRRLADASSLVDRTLDHPAWERFAETFPTLERYRDMAPISPQLGLVPLQVNPRSGLWEFWHVNSGERPEIEDPETAELAIRPETGIVLVLLPGGEFWMGTPPDQQQDEGWADEVHHQRSVEPFFLSRYETTQAQWERIFQSNPSTYPAGYLVFDLVEITPTNPVETVSWHECVEMARRLALRLPSEPEWEYACRAGSPGLFTFGSDPAGLEGYANVLDQSTQGVFADQQEFPWDDGFPAHAPVGSFELNGFGLHDVHGNVSEWTADEYDPDLSDQVEERTGKYVFRGGDWYSAVEPQYWMRCATRSNWLPGGAEQRLGVRLARSVDW